MTISEKVRTLREQRGFSQRKLAELSGLSSGTLSNLEAGKFRGELETHQKLARGFGVTLAELYRGVDELDDGSTSVIPASGGGEIYRYNDKAEFRMLATHIFQKPFLPQRLILQPGGSTHVEQTNIGWKWLCLITGQVDITIGEQSHRLENLYDSIFVKASDPHQITNVGASVAECLTVTSPVGV